MKLVKDVLSKIKGEDKVNDILTGKGSYSQQGYGDVVNALANDTTWKTKSFDKNGNPVGEVNLSELIREDIKKTIAKAGYPQKSEINVIDTAEIFTSGITELTKQAPMEYMACGKKFDMPTKPNVVGSIYLTKVPGKVKTTQVRDPKTQQNLGSVTITSKDSVQIRAKSPVPNHLQTKVRKDPSGKIVTK